MRSIVIPLLALILGATGALSAQQRPVPAGVRITIHTPEPEQLELALDELELDWAESGRAGRIFAQQPLVIPNTTLSERDVTRAVFKVTGATTAEDLAATSRALEGANPGAEANFVLYQPDTGRDAGTRRVLTTHMALVLEDAADPAGVLVELAARNPQPLDGVPGGFVVEASDPLSAMQLSDAIRGRTGVKAAYPLVKRRQFVR